MSHPPIRVLRQPIRPSTCEGMPEQPRRRCAKAAPESNGILFLRGVFSERRKCQVGTPSGNLQKVPSSLPAAYLAIFAATNRPLAEEFLAERLIIVCFQWLLMPRRHRVRVSPPKPSPQ